MVSISPQYVALAFLMSFATVALVIFGAQRIVRRSRTRARLLDTIRDESWYPSLSLFQFVMWTSVIAFLYLGVYLTRVFGGVFDILPPIPTNLLTLMGISVTVPIISGGISAAKYRTEKPKDRPDKPLPFSTMLEENKKPTTARFQMFVWTWIGVIIYFAVFLGMITKSGVLDDVSKLYLPDIDPVLVVLMGLSQGAYVGGKLIAVQAMEITQVVPSEANAGQTISIFGSNFGDVKDTVWFGNLALHHKDIDSWTNERIDLKVPTGLKADDCSIKVAEGGNITPEKKFKIT